MSKHIKLFMTESWLLLVAAVVFGLGLATLHGALKETIERNEREKFNRLAGAMITDAGEFTVAETVMVDVGKGKIIKTEIKKGLDGEGNVAGWAFVTVGAGFADKIKLVVAVDAKFEKIKGFGVLSSNETPGFGDKIKTEDFYGDQFEEAPAAEFTLTKVGDAGVIDSEIIAITGATVTSQAVVDTLNAFVGPVKKQMKEKGLL